MQTITRFTALALAALSLQACTGGGKEDATDDFSALDGVDEKADAFSSRMKIVGSLDYGQTSDAVKYTRSPIYRAFKFSGREGDQVDVWVRSSGGDALTWVLDNKFKILAKNDDADEGNTFDSHITVTLPASRSNTHYIVFRDYWMSRASFTVSLGNKSPASGCTTDLQCMAVVRLSDPNTLAECNNDTHTCEVVQALDISCGGNSANAHACPGAWQCQDIGYGPDRPGRCMKPCGGIAGLACDTGYSCHDNPYDSCDPANGGADCGGYCYKFCGGIAGFSCTGGYTCNDNPDDSCDPNHGGADCGGICQPVIR